MTDYIQIALIRFIALLPALTLHEFAHAYTAFRAGDPTAKMLGRVTLNPLPHLDPIGTIAILFFPIGWAKPVPVNPMNFRNPGRDDIIVSASGPAANILQAVFWALILRLLATAAPGIIWTPDGSASVAAGFLAFMVLLNFALAIFNLMPIGPLDGHHIMENILPYPHSEKYRVFNSRYGIFVLIAMIFLGGRVLFQLIALPTVFIGGPLSGINILWTISESGLLY